MKRALVLACASVCLLSLTACANDHFAQNVGTLTAAGCTGKVHLDGGVSTAVGLSPGAAHGTFYFDGACDKANLPPPPAPPNG